MFHVGQLVLCADDDFDPNQIRRWPGVTFPRRGVVYTVRDAFVEPRFTPRPHDLFLRLVEIVNKPQETYIGPYETMFGANRFRPLDDSRLEVFRQLLVNPPKQEEVAA